MNQEYLLQLQAYLDGELPEAEARLVEARLQQDAAARDLLAELRQTRTLLAGQEAPRPVPESREFYWSKISRQIGREAASRVRDEHGVAIWMRWLRFAFSPVGAVAAVAALAVAGILWFQTSGAHQAAVESDGLIEGQVMTFHDQQEQMTVVWLSYNE